LRGAAPARARRPADGGDAARRAGADRRRRQARARARRRADRVLAPRAGDDGRDARGADLPARARARRGHEAALPVTLLLDRHDALDLAAYRRVVAERETVELAPAALER